MKFLGEQGHLVFRADFRFFYMEINLIPLYCGRANRQNQISLVKALQVSNLLESLIGKFKERSLIGQEEFFKFYLPIPGERHKITSSNRFLLKIYCQMKTLFGVMALIEGLSG